MAVTITAITKKLLDEASIADGKETETQVFDVTTSETDLTPLEVERASGAVGGVTYPAYGAAHAIDPQLRVLRKKARRLPGKGDAPVKNIWRVEVDYSNVVASFGGPTGSTGTSDNIRIEISGVEQTIYTQQARDTAMTSIRNAVGDLYPDGIEVTLYDEQISISFETDAIDADLIAQSRGKINSAPVTFTIPQGDLSVTRTFAPHTLLLRRCDYSVIISKLDGETHRFGVQLVLLYRTNIINGVEYGWDAGLPQKGYRWFVDVSTDLTAWQPHAEYLDGDGFKLADGAPIVVMDPVQRNYEADLAALLSGI